MPLLRGLMTGDDSQPHQDHRSSPSATVTSRLRSVRRKFTIKQRPRRLLACRPAIEPPKKMSLSEVRREAHTGTVSARLAVLHVQIWRPVSPAAAPTRDGPSAWVLSVGWPVVGEWREVSDQCSDGLAEHGHAYGLGL